MISPRRRAAALAAVAREAARVAKVRDAERDRRDDLAAALARAAALGLTFTEISDAADLTPMRVSQIVREFNSQEATS